MKTMLIENKDNLSTIQLNWIKRIASKDSFNTFKDLGNGYGIGFEITPNGNRPSGWISINLQHPMTKYGVWVEDVLQEFFSNDGVQATKEDAIYKALVVVRKLINKYGK